MIENVESILAAVGTGTKITYTVTETMEKKNVKWYLCGIYMHLE